LPLPNFLRSLLGTCEAKFISFAMAMCRFREHRRDGGFVHWIWC